MQWLVSWTEDILNPRVLSLSRFILSTIPVHTANTQTFCLPITIRLPLAKVVYKNGNDNVAVMDLESR